MKKRMRRTKIKKKNPENKDEPTAGTTGTHFAAHSAFQIQSTQVKKKSMAPVNKELLTETVPVNNLFLIVVELASQMDR